MRYVVRPLRTLCVATAVSVAAVAGAQARPVMRPNTVPVQRSYIVRYRDTVAAASVTSRTDAVAQALGFRIRFRYHAVLRGFAASLTAAQVSALRANPSIAAVEPDGTMHIDSVVPLKPGELTLAGSSVLGADWTDPGRRIDSIQSSASDPGPFVHEPSRVAIAVLDTGADLSHPDLSSVRLGTDCVTPDTPTAADGNGHGTEVTGEIAAANQGTGMAGVVPGSRVYAVRVFDATGSGATSQVICGMDWVAANAARLDIKVANMSFGGGGTNDNNCGLTDGNMQHVAICALTAAGVTPVVAAGNADQDFGPDTAPADFPEVLTVTAMVDSDGQPGGLGPNPVCLSGQQVDDTAATFSNFATSAADEAHTIAAPGVCVVSDAPDRPFALQGFDTDTDPNYSRASGTSQAAPLVAGAVARCLGQRGARAPAPCAGLTPAQIVQKMVSDAAAHAAADPSYGFTGDPQHPIGGNYYGNLVWLPHRRPTVTVPRLTSGVVNQPITFTGTASDPDGPIVSATWHFGNGTSGDGLSASTVYTAPGVHRVSLTVTDQDGLTATAHGRVVIQ